MLGLILSALGLGGLGAAAFLYPPLGALILGAARTALAWLSRQSPATLLCIALALLLVVDHGALLMAHRHERKVEAQLGKCTAGRAADRQAYIKAQADAAAANKAQVAKVEQQQQKVTDDVEARYRADLARLRAERGKLQPANPAPQRPASGSGSSAPSPAPGGPGNQAVPLPPAELLRAQETELQLNALIDWVLQQASIDPNR
jgi:hypothetical protein